MPYSPYRLTCILSAGQERHTLRPPRGQVDLRYNFAQLNLDGIMS